MKIGSTITASAKANDPDGDPLTYRWAIYGDDIRKDEKNREINLDGKMANHGIHEIHGK